MLSKCLPLIVLLLGLGLALAVGRAEPPQTMGGRARIATHQRG